MLYTRVEKCFTLLDEPVPAIEIHHLHLRMQKNALQTTQARIGEYRK
jgi:ABC-type hemin transport system ATPase subunit